MAPPEQQTAPARAVIHPTIAWPVITVTAVFIGGWLYAYAGAAVFSPWWLLVAGPVLAALGGMVARTHWDEADYGVRHTRSGVWLARVAGYGAGCWLAWSGWATPGAALGLLVLGALPLWLWFAVLSWRAPRQAAVMLERYDQGRQIVRDRSWRQILDRAGCDDVVITDVREHRGGMVLTVEPDPEVGKAPTYQDFAGRAKAIGTAAAMHYRRTGTPLPLNAVRPEEGSDDAEFLLNVTMRDVFAEATAYVPDYAPGDITRALDIGEYEDASRILITITGHMKIVGMTGCIAADTRIYLPDTGEHVRVDTLAARGESVTVLAWDGQGFVRARTDGAPFVKGVAELFEVTCSDGATMRVTGQHRFLTPTGWRRLEDVRAGQLLAAAPHVRPEADGGGPSGCPAGARRWSSTPAGSPGHCATCRRPGGRRPHPAAVDGPGVAPSRPGELARTPLRSLPDAPAAERARSRVCLRCSRPARNPTSPAGGPARTAGSRDGACCSTRSSESCRAVAPHPRLTESLRTPAGVEPDRGSSQDAQAPSLPTSCAVRSRPRGAESGASLPSRRDPALSGRESLRRGSADGSRQVGAESACRCEAPCEVIKWNRVRTIRPVGRAVYYDLAVPGPENYVAEGMVNHNSGKSVVANNLIARISACSNALIWVTATNKLIPLVWPWLKSWFEGRSVAPLLDFVAGTSPHEVLKLLRAAYKLACDRNDRLTDRSKMRPTATEPAVFVFLDETSHAVEFQDTIDTHDGQDVTVSDLLKMIAEAGRSANVWVILLSQYALNAGLGDRAAEMIRNLTMRICLRTMESHDGFRTLPGLPTSVDTTAIPLHTMLVQPSIEVARAVPGKAAELDGSEQIDPIAVRQAAWRPAGVEPESDLGPDYATRWDERRHPQLARAVVGAGLSWRAPGGTIGDGGPVDTGPGTRVPVDATGGEGGGDVDTDADGWTDDDDAALRAFLDPDGSAERARPFQLPDPREGLARLQRLADQMGDPPPDRSDCDPDRSGPDECEADRTGPGVPVPEPLRSVVVWLDRSGRDPDGWVRTEELVRGIEWPRDAQSLGRALSRIHPSVRSKNLPREFDPRQRNGYPVRLLREAADRFRFGMP